MGGKTGVVQKKGASLSTVLSQALQSEDVEQLDWVLAQQDSVLVEQTLEQVGRDPKTTTKLFS